MTQIDAPITSSAMHLYGAAGRLLSCRDPEILIEGRAGTGKTVATAKKLVDACWFYPGSRHMLCRQTRESMTDTTLVTLESVIGEAHPEVQRVSREQRHSYRLWGSEIVLAGLDTPSKEFGSAFGLIVVEEAIEIALDAWELFGRAARDPKLRRRHDRVVRFPYHQRIAVTNPGACGHWLNRRAHPCKDDVRTVESYADLVRCHAYGRDQTPQRMRRLVSVHHDNPRMFDTRAWAWTDEGRKYLDELDSMSGARRKRMRYGLWAAAEGAVFPEFDESKHVIPPFDIPRDWPVRVAKDPGRDHPDATIFCATAPNGRRYYFLESVVRQTTVAQDAATLTKLCEPFNVVKKLGDPHYMFSLTKMSDTGRTIAEQMRDYGHVFIPAPAARNHTEIAQQCDIIRTGLTTIGTDGQPMIQVFSSCPKLINGFQSWGYVRNTKGEMTGGEDKFEDVGDDEMDCIRMIEASGPGFSPMTCEVYPGE